MADSFFADISQRFNKKLKVAAVDVDILVNIMDKESQVEEAEHVLHNLRQTRRTIDTLESTHHAVCRFFLNVNAADRLLQLIQQPVRFGVFPDSFCFTMLIDRFLSDGMVSEAAHTATLYMLQEEFSNTLTNLLAVHAVLQFLQLDERPEIFLSLFPMVSGHACLMPMPVSPQASPSLHTHPSPSLLHTDAEASEDKRCLPVGPAFLISVILLLLFPL